MKKTIRFIMPLPILVGMSAAFYLETRSQLSTAGHTTIEVVIVAATCWLAWRWVVYDETCNLREVRNPGPAHYHYRVASASLPENAKSLQNALATEGLSGTTKAAPGASLPAPWKRYWNKASGEASVSLARVAHALMSVGIVFTLTLVMHLIGVKILGEGVIALLYLVPMSWCTVRWGQLAGVSAAMTAALSFDYLFIPPYGTFHIGSLEGWLLLFLFIATSILVVGRIQSVLTEERERQRRATFLYEVVAAISNQATREGVARAIASQIRQKFLVENVRVHLSGGWGYPSFTTYEDQRRAAASNEKPSRTLSIVSGSETIGEIAIWQGAVPLPASDDPMLQTMLRQIAAALNRVRMAEGRPPYPGQKPSYPEGGSLQASRS